MELAEAYITIRADTTELKTGLQRSKATVESLLADFNASMKNVDKETEQSTKRITSYMDKQASRLTSAFMRMGGGIAMIRASVSAIGRAFEEIRAEKAFDTAKAAGNINAMVGAYQRANTASRRWMESIPFLGGALGQLWQSLRNDSVERLAQMLGAVEQRARGATGSIYAMAEAEIRLAEASGQTGVAAGKKAGLEERVETQNIRQLSAARTEARDVMEEAVQTVETARKRREGAGAIPFAPWGAPRQLPGAKRETREVEALHTIAQEAQFKYLEADKKYQEAMKARPVLSAARVEEIRKAEKVGTMPAGGGMPPPGIVVGTPEDTLLLREIRDELRNVDRLK